MALSVTQSDTRSLCSRCDCPPLCPAREDVSVKDIPVSKEMWSSQVILGTSAWAPTGRVGRMSISGCAADSEDVGCYNITTESGDMAE